MSQSPGMQFWRPFWQLAWPVSLQSILLSSMGFVDVLMVGQLGDTGVAAVGFAGKAHFVAIILLAGMATACSILASQYWGLRRLDAIRRVILMTCITGMVLVVPVILWLMLAGERIMRLGSDDLQVIALGAEYLLIASPMLLASLILMAFESGLRATGDTRAPLWISAFGVMLNVLFNYALVPGNWGLPALGVAGAAWATLAARTLELVVAVAYLHLRRHPVRLGGGLPLAEMSLPHWLNYWRLALPLVLNFAIWSLGVFIYAALYGGIGRDALAAIAVISPIEGMLIACFIGFSTACSIMVGNNLGAERFCQAWQLGVRFVWFSPMMALLFGAAVLLCQDGLLGWFDELTAATQDSARNLLFILSMLLWMKVLNLVVIQGILRSGGDHKFCLYLDTLTMWGLGIPLTLVAAYYWHWPIERVYLMSFVEEGTKLVLCLLRFRQRKWLQSLVSDEPSPAAVVL